MCVRVNGFERATHLLWWATSFGKPLHVMRLGWPFLTRSSSKRILLKARPWSAGQLLKQTEQFSACRNFGGSKFHGSFMVLRECRTSKVLWAFLVATSDGARRPQYSQTSALWILTGLKINPIHVMGLSLWFLTTSENYLALFAGSQQMVLMRLLSSLTQYANDAAKRAAGTCPFLLSSLH